MYRYKLTIEYAGTFFCGWQRQPNARSVQEMIEKAFKKFCPRQRPSPELKVAGRTDAGVHAKGQVAHVDLEQHYPEYTVRKALNHYLLDYPISVLDVQMVPPDFHARFSATKRIYEYIIANRSEKLALDDHRAWHVPFPLDVNLMREGAAFLVGHHDFSSFRSSECQAKNPVRTLESITFSQKGIYVQACVQAQSFLHHQVRNMIGSLVEVGRRKRSPIWIQEALQAKDRTKSGPMAPAEGLYLKEIVYGSRESMRDESA